MAPTETQRLSRQLFTELEAGERVQLTHEVIVGNQRWPATITGTVVKTERRRHSLHYHRNFDDKVFSDLVILELDDGERTTVTLDEFTELKRVGHAAPEGS